MVARAREDVSPTRPTRSRRCRGRRPVDDSSTRERDASAPTKPPIPRTSRRCPPTERTIMPLVAAGPSAIRRARRRLVPQRRCCRASMASVQPAHASRRAHADHGSARVRPPSPHPERPLRTVLSPVHQRAPDVAPGSRPDRAGVPSSCCSATRALCLHALVLLAPARARQAPPPAAGDDARVGYATVVPHEMRPGYVG